MNVGFLKDLVALSDRRSDKLEFVVVLPAGVVELSGMPPMAVDRDSALAVIATFRDKGVKVPIDYEHSSLKKAEKGDESPAVGWVSDLHWDSTKGLVGKVEWNEKGFNSIVAGEYKYLSPVVFLDEKTRKPVSLHSVALTNKPRIKNQEELRIAASETLLRSDEDMATSTATPDWVTQAKNLHKRKVKRVMNQDDDGADGGGSEDMVGELLPIIEGYKELLIAAGIEIPEEATPADILNAAGEYMVYLMGEVDSGDDTRSPEEVAEEVAMRENMRARDKALMVAMRNSLDLPDDCDIQDVVKAVEKTKAHVGWVSLKEHQDLQKRFNALSEKVTDEENNATIAEFISQGKLNPNDSERMKWARSAIKADHDSFVALMSEAPIIMDLGKKVGTDTGDKDIKAKSVTDQRKEVIVAASEQWESAAKVRAMCSQVAWVNSTLSENELRPLSTSEEIEYKLIK